MGDVTVLSGLSGCVDCDTEYFNGTEWKKISDYSYGDKSSTNTIKMEAQN